MKKFKFNPTTPIYRAFDALAEFRQQAFSNKWKKKEIQQAIKKSTSDGETIFEMCVKLAKEAGLDNQGNEL